MVDPLSRATVQLDDLSRPGTAAVSGSSLARSVRATGTYDGQRTYVVLERTETGSQPWSMTPLLLPDGSVIPVVHGRLAALADATDVVVPRGTVEVTGRLQASQSPGVPGSATAGGSDPAAGVLSGVSTSELAGLVDQPIRPGFVLASSQTPAVNGVEPLTVDTVVVPPRGVRVQNVLYTLQWSLFSAFVVFVYWRLMRDAWRDHNASPSQPNEPPAGADPAPRDSLEETTA